MRPGSSGSVDGGASPTPAPAPPLAAEVGVGSTLFGKYQVLRKLGEGGMGTVWLVRHLDLGCLRALKMILAGIATDPDMRQRFKREARAMASFGHPHAVAVHDTLLGPDYGYIEMEYVEGGSVDAMIELGVPMPLGWTVRVVEQLCDVLSEAHANKIIHRDLKPSNLMLLARRAPGREFLKVLDFGLAKILEEAAVTLTRDGFVGTVSYASPEQARGDTIDHRADLYSVGVLIYEFLTGCRPFAGPIAQQFKEVVHSAPPPPAARNPFIEVDADLEAFLMRCLSKDPAGRPGSALELADEFAKVARGGLALRSQIPLRDPKVLEPEPVPSNVPTGSRSSKSSARTNRPPSSSKETLPKPVRTPTPLPATRSPSSVIERLHSPTLRPPRRLPSAEEMLAAVKSEPELTTATAPGSASGIARGPVVAPDSSSSPRRRLLGATLIRQDAQALVVGDDRVIRSLMLADGRERHQIKAPGPISAVLFPDDGRRVLLGGPGVVWVLDATSGHEICRYIGHDVGVSALASDEHRGDQVILSGAVDGGIALWEPRGGQELRKLAGGGAAISALAFSDAGRLAIGGDLAGTLRLWDLERGEEVRSESACPGGVTALAALPGVGMAVASGQDGSTYVWDLIRGIPGRAFVEGESSSPVTALRLCPDGRRLLGGHADGQVSVWDLHDGRVLQHFDGHVGRVTSVCWSRDLAQALSAGDDGAVRVWDLPAHEPAPAGGPDPGTARRRGLLGRLFGG